MGGRAGAFLRVGTTARSIAMGGGFTAEIARGFPAYHNPGSLALLSDRQVSFSQHLLSLDRNVMAASFATSLPPTGGLGVAWLRAGVSDIDGRSTAGEHTQTYSTGEQAFMISFAQNIQSWISVGINVKILRQSLPLNSSDVQGKGIGVDLGIMMRPVPEMMMALMIQDLNSAYHWNTSEIYEKGSTYKEEFPVSYRIGTTYQWNDFYFTGDAGLYTDHQYFLGTTFRVGTEYRYKKHYFLRAGFDNQRIAAGVGMEYSLMDKQDSNLDYAFILDNPAGFSHVFTYALQF